MSVYDIFSILHTKLFCLVLSAYNLYIIYTTYTRLTGIFRKYRYDRYEISSILQTKPFIQREQTFAYWDRKYATLPSRIVLSFYRSDSSMLFYKLLKSFNDCRRMPNKQKQKYVLLTLQDPNFCVHDISIVTTETSSLITLNAYFLWWNHSKYFLQ